MATEGGKIPAPLLPKDIVYAKTPADRVMLRHIPTAASTETVQQVRERVLHRKAKWDTINYIYVLDSKKRLKGVLSIRELLEAPLKTKMKKFERKHMVVAYPHSKLPLVAGRTLLHNIKSCPIIDAKGRLLGVVGSDTVMDTLEREHVRDVLGASGVAQQRSFADVFSAKITKVIEWRLPWLVTGLFGGMLATTIVDGFSQELSEVIELAFFIPVMVYMGAAVGNQTQMLFIRGLSYRQVDAKKYLLREMVIDVFIGAVIAVLLGLFALLLTSKTIIMAIVAIAVFFIVSSAGLVAILISLILMKLRRDPAVGGGPFTTIIQDLTSLIIYFTVASLLLL